MVPVVIRWPFRMELEDLVNQNVRSCWNDLQLCFMSLSGPGAFPEGIQFKAERNWNEDSIFSGWSVMCYLSGHIHHKWNVSL